MTLNNSALPWSYSKLSTWETCRKMYKYKYILNHRYPSGPAAQRGIELHGLCERFVNGNVSWEDFTAEVLKHKCVVGGNFFEYISKLEQLRREIAANPDDTENSCDTELKIKVDSEFNLVPSDATNYAAVFVFDVLLQSGNNIEIIDYKTGNIYEDAHEFQAGIYAYAVYCIMGVVPRVVFVYLDKNTNKIYKFSQEDLADVDAVITTILKEIDEEKDFNQTKDLTKCRWCVYKNLCRGQ